MRLLRIFTLVALCLAFTPSPAMAVTGFDSAYSGESAFVNINPGETASFQVFFSNTGTLAWSKGTDTQVDLATCLEDKVTCNAQDPSEATWNSGWLSNVRYATHTQTIVSTGSLATFAFSIKAPSSATGAHRFNGELVVAKTGARIHPQGYYQDATVAAVGSVTGPTPGSIADPAVVTAWNTIAVRTIAGPAPLGVGKANAEAFLWYAFVHAAVYNAVVGITADYELYKWNERAPSGASPQAAAAAAAHRVLKTYFGGTSTIAARLDADLATSLGQIPDGAPKEQGIQYGQRAADRLISLRVGDGRSASVVFNPPQPTAPGVWRPTPPGNGAFLAPWLGQVNPLVLDSLTQFAPGPPPAIASDLYVREFNEVRDYGVKLGSLRSAAQTETALFFFDIAITPIQAALRDLVTRRHLGISDTARVFAAVDLSLADAVGTVWNAKLRYGWWRPITAIREADTDGNPATSAVAGWEPLIATPPYPDWPSGLTSVIGALSTSLSRLNADGRVDLNISSAAAGVTRHYDVAALIQGDAVNARVWSGIHFRTADEVSAAIGTKVANWTLDHYFARTIR
jgi:hypothetical protein